VSPHCVQDLKVIKPGGEHAYADALQTAKLSKPVYQVRAIMVCSGDPTPPAWHGVRCMVLAATLPPVWMQGHSVVQALHLHACRGCQPLLYCFGGCFVILHKHSAQAAW
jgi:hypothetical protein